MTDGSFNPFDNFPLMWVSSLVPQTERDDAYSLLMAAEALPGFVRDFGMAVRLFNTASVEHARARAESSESARERADTFFAWQRIAARDGAIQIYHLGAVMNSIRAELRSSPTLLGLTNSIKARTAVKLLESHFPNYELIRNAVAHSLHEVAPTSKLLKKHSTDAPIEIPGLIKSQAKGLVIADSLWGNRYVVTFEKKVAYYEISDASQAKLQSVSNCFLAGFEPAREAFKASRRRGPPSAGVPPPSG